MTSYTLAVGELYDPRRTSFPTTEQVRIDRSLCELIRYWPDPTRDEVAAHDSGAAEFALVDESPDLMLLAYRFGDLAWSDASFQAHRLTTNETGWPAGGPVDGLLFRTVLVDAGTGVIRSLRYDEWTAAFANAVRVAVAEQLIHEFDDEAAGRRRNAVYSAFATPEDMVRARAVATCATSGPAMGGKNPISVQYY